MNNKKQPIHFLQILNRTLLLTLLTLLSACATLSSSPPVSPAPDHYDTAPAATAAPLHTRSNLTLFAQWWTPTADVTPKAVVILVHGTYVHSGFYSDWAQHLTQNGYAVLGLDMRGWGQSQGQGRAGFVNNFNEYLEDVQLAWKQARDRYPDRPLFLQGESLGGLVSLMTQQDSYMPVDGLILNAPAVRPAMEIGFVRTPQWLASSTLWAMSFPGEITPNMPVLVPGAVTEMFAGFAVDSDSLVDTFKNDPHVMHDALPLGFITALEEGCTQAQENMAGVHVPLLVLQGTDDVLVPVSSSEFVIDNVRSQDKTLKIYEGMSHATLHDTGHERVWHDIVAWLDARTAR